MCSALGIEERHSSLSINKQSLQEKRETHGNLEITPWSTTPSILSRLSATSAAIGEEKEYSLWSYLQ